MHDISQVKKASMKIFIVVVVVVFGYNRKARNFLGGEVACHRYAAFLEVSLESSTR